MTHLVEEVRFLDRGRPPDKGQIGTEPVFGSIDCNAQSVERVEDLNLDRPDQVGISAVEWRTARGVNVDLFGVDRSTIKYDAEVSVSDMPIGVQAHRERKEQTGVLRVAVEEVAVVVVEVSPGGLGHRV